MRSLHLGRRSPESGERERLVIAHCDKDFGELVYRLHKIHAGVVLVRHAGLTEDAKAEIVAEVFRDREPEFGGGFAVISPGMVRIRRLPPAGP